MNKIQHTVVIDCFTQHDKYQQVRAYLIDTEPLRYIERYPKSFLKISEFVLICMETVSSYFAYLFRFLFHISL